MSEQRLVTEQHLALEHIAACPDCRAVQLALAALSAERRRPTPVPPPGALHRAVAAATAVSAGAVSYGHGHRGSRRRGGPALEQGRRPGFWAGMGLGAAVAAGLAAAVFAFMPSVWRMSEHGGITPAATAAAAVHAPRVTPEISMALNETRDVNISVEAPTALPDAEIRVVLTGAIELAGFEGQKELRWRTDLAAGPNQLRLPIVALGGVGGQLLVEVQHGERHRTFVVDVKATSAQQPRA
jgi:hypothetical protein